jgi:hypothetical protein
MTQDKPRHGPRSDGKHPGEPTPQGFQSADPGNVHGVPPGDSPALGGLEERPVSPEGGRPAADPERMARRVLDQAREGPRTKDDAGPLGAETEARKRGQDR